VQARGDRGTVGRHAPLLCRHDRTGRYGDHRELHVRCVAWRAPTCVSSLARMRARRRVRAWRLWGSGDVRLQPGQINATGQVTRRPFTCNTRHCRRPVRSSAYTRRYERRLFGPGAPHLIVAAPLAEERTPPPPRRAAASGLCSAQRRYRQRRPRRLHPRPRKVRSVRERRGAIRARLPACGACGATRRRCWP
jgi:hypothetical protein